MKQYDTKKSLNYDIIHFNLFDPTKSIFKSNGNARAEFQTIKCCNYENCQLYSKGQCAARSMMGGCMYGKYNAQQGFTKRAGKFYSWMQERKKEYEGIPFLNSPGTCMASVGDYIYLPYSHMDMCKAIRFVMGRFLEKKDFTIENIIKLVHLRPQAMFGGEIKTYQKEIIPDFLRHLKRFDKELYERVCEKSELASQIAKNLTDVGKKAKLFTVIPKVGLLKDIHGGEWLWDGEWLTCKNRNPSFMIVNDVEEIRIKPLGDPVVKITDDKQVSKDTIFEN